MFKAIVLGAQWGDEGKGKIVDLLAKNADVVVRFQGGANAGHTLVFDGKKLVLHLLPSGITRTGTMNIIGPGCVVDLAELVREIEQVRSAGFEISPQNLALSPGAHVVTPVHRLLDKLTGGTIGTTSRGIGPCYADKVRRTGIRVSDVIKNDFGEKLERIFLDARALAETGCQDDSEEFFPRDSDDISRCLSVWHSELLSSARKIAPFVTPVEELIHHAIISGKNILYEGAQGTMLDIDHGTYPFVTSSSTTIGGAYSGGGVFIEFDRRIAVVKAYTTRVGNGPFPTEEKGETGNILRETGREYGATTGRPRRCGWLDLFLLKKAFIHNGFNRIALTKLDCLSSLETIKVATARDEKDNPVYLEFPGWKCDIQGIRDYMKLPTECRNYIEFIERELGVPATIISTGHDRDMTVVREELK